VGVGVEEPVAQDHLQAQDGRAPGQGSAVDTRCVERGQVVHLGAAELLEGEHPCRGEVAEHPGDPDGGVPGEVGGEALGVGGLGDIVELGPQRVAELAGESGHVVAAGPVDPAAGGSRQPLEDGQVVVDPFDDAGPADLDDDLGAVVQQAGVRLADRRRGDRLRVDPPESVEATCALQLVAQDRGNGRPGLGGRPVLEPGQLGLVVGGQEIGAGRHDLAELDEGGPEVLEREAYVFRSGDGGVCGAAILGGTANARTPRGPATQPRP
jgi:hypothetical protein